MPHAAYQVFIRGYECGCLALGFKRFAKDERDGRGLVLESSRPPTAPGRVQGCRLVFFVALAKARPLSRRR